MEMRVTALTHNRHRMSRRVAEQFIRNIDRDRTRWVRRMYDADVADSALYDLTINLRETSVQTACTIIATLARHEQYQVTDEARAAIQQLVEHHFDLRPGRIINALDLWQPIYQQTAAYGHFGREDLDLPWERTDKAAVLREDAGLA